MEEQLSDYILAEVMSLLPQDCLLAASLVCRRWNRVSRAAAPRALVEVSSEALSSLRHRALADVWPAGIDELVLLSGAPGSARELGALLGARPSRLRVEECAVPADAALAAATVPGGDGDGDAACGCAAACELVARILGGGVARVAAPPASALALSRLRVLDVSGCSGVDDDAVDAICEHHLARGLERLSIARCRRVTVASLARVLRGPAPDLVALDASGLDLNTASAACEKRRRTCPRLQVISLAMCVNAGPETWALIEAACWDSLLAIETGCWELTISVLRSLAVHRQRGDRIALQAIVYAPVSYQVYCYDIPPADCASEKARCHQSSLCAARSCHPALALLNMFEHYKGDDSATEPPEKRRRKASSFLFLVIIHLLIYFFFGLFFLRAEQQAEMDRDAVIIHVSAEDAMKMTARQVFDRAMRTGEYEVCDHVDVYHVSAEDAKTMTAEQVVKRAEAKKKKKKT